MKKLIFFVLVCGVMSACIHDEYHDLPTDKVTLIKNNDIVYFKDSISNKIDTFNLIRNDYRSVTTESWTNSHWLQIYIYYNKIPRGTNYFKYDITTRTATVGGYDFFLNSSNVLYDFSLNSISYPIKGFTYQSVYLAYKNTPDTIPNKVYFTCQKGIIRYEYKDGRVYNLVSK